jgi:hypothetical protein
MGISITNIFPPSSVPTLSANSTNCSTWSSLTITSTLVLGTYYACVWIVNNASVRTWDFLTRVGTSADRNLRFAFNELHTLKDKLGLPDTIIEKTAYIYKQSTISVYNLNISILIWSLVNCNA